MAREQRYDVDYFPHECTHGRKMHIIETKYGNDGYAAWFKLLEQLGKANNHYIDVSDEMNLMFIISIFKVEKETAISILDDLAKLNAIDKYLYENHKIIFSKKFIESIRDAYRKRKTTVFEYSDLLDKIRGKNDQSGGRNTHVSGQTGGSLPEVIPKEKKSKEKKSKEEDNKEIKIRKIINNDVFFETSLNSPQWIESVCMTQGLHPEKLKLKIEEFRNHLISIGEQKTTERDFKSHFINWISKNKTYAETTKGITKNR